MMTGVGPQFHDLGQEIQPVHPRHLDVEGDHVGVQFADHLAAFGGIGRSGDDLDIGFLAQPVHQDGAHGGGNHRR